MSEHAPVERYRECATELRALPTVVAVDVLDTDIRTGTPTIETVVDADAAPPQVLRCLASHDRHVDDVSQRGEPTHTVVLAR